MPTPDEKASIVANYLTKKPLTIYNLGGLRDELGITQQQASTSMGLPKIETFVDNFETPRVSPQRSPKIAYRKPYIEKYLLETLGLKEYKPLIDKIARDVFRLWGWPPLTPQEELDYFAYKGAYIVPRRSSAPPELFGRGQLYEEIKELLFEPHNIALEGPPGVGKSELAYKIVQDEKIRDHFEHAIIWTDIGQHPSYDAILLSWAEALHINISKWRTVRDLARQIHNQIEQRKVLIVLNDAWHEEDVEVLRIQLPNCAQLLTTRNEAIARKFAGPQNTRKIPVLESEDSYRLLQHLAPETYDVAPTELRQLADAVGGLPLALVLIGGYLGLSIKSRRRLEQISDPKRRLQLFVDRLEYINRDVTDEQKTLEAVISLSLEEFNHHEQLFFYNLGAFAPRPEQFDIEAAQAIALTPSLQPHIDFNELIEELTISNLIDFDGLQDLIAVHQVIADVARLQTPSATEDRHRDYYLNIVSENPENILNIIGIYGQIKWAWHHSLQKDPQPEILITFISLLYIFQERWGVWKDMQAWAEQGKEIGQILNSYTLTELCLRVLSYSCINLGEFQKAIATSQEALGIFKHLSDQRTKTSHLKFIGIAKANLAEYKDANSYLLQALDDLKETGSPEQVAGIFIDLGNLADEQGDVEQALDFFDSAMSLAQETKNQELLARCYFHLGIGWSHLRDYAKAMENYSKSFKITGELNNLTLMARNLVNIGEIYLLMEDYEGAFNLYLDAWAIVEQSSERQIIGIIMSNLGIIYAKRKDFLGAHIHYLRAQSIASELGDRKQQHIVAKNRGQAYMEEGKYQDAIYHFESALKIAIDILPNSYETGITSAQLGLALAKEGSLDAVSKHVSMAQSIAEQLTDSRQIQHIWKIIDEIKGEI